MYYDEYSASIIAQDRRREIEADMLRRSLLKALQPERGNDNVVKSVAHAVSQQWGRWFHLQPATRA